MSFVIFNRLDRSSPSRVTITNANINGKVFEFKKLVSENIKFPENEIELLYGGEKLKDDGALSAYDIKEGAVIHALRREPSEDATQSEKMSRGEVQDVVRALQGALANPAYRNTVEKILAKPDTLQTLIATTPALSRDPVAVGMLQDPELLGILADPKYIDKVMERHPGLAQAAVYITSALREENKSQAASGRRRGAGHYSLDRMSDDEEEMDTSQPGQPITTNLLASALAAATAGHSQPSQASTSGSADGGGTSGGAMPGGSSGISADFFRHALQQAMTGSGQSQPQQQPAVTESQLQQLREMGITDENVARQALTVAGGDIQGALEIIFGEGL